MSPTNPEDARYTLTELADLAGVTPRTVRYYLAQGLLPAVGVAGPGAKYDDAHLARLRLIKRLQREHQPLAEIRRELDSLDDAQVLAIEQEPASTPPPDSALDYIRRITAPTRRLSEGRLLRRLESTAMPAPAAMSAAAPTPASANTFAPTSPLAPTAPAAPAPDPTPRIERSQWERVVLGPDIELHIRRPLPRSTAKRVDRLVEFARDLLEEELP